MSDFMLHTDRQTEQTAVSNIFLDEYMPAANGEYVKIYLYLLRCLKSGNKSLSIPVIADTFDHTENDVTRALSYWEKMQLLRLEYDDSRTLTGIYLCDPGVQRSEKESAGPKGAMVTKDSMAAKDTMASNGSMVSKEAIIPEEPAAPKKTSYTADQLIAFKSQESIRQLLFISEQYLGKTLSPTEISTILYFYDSLHFSSDLIEYLIEYCVSKGHKSIRYIESVALSWSEEGFTTVAQAKKGSAIYNKAYFSVLKAFGIKGRNPVDAEIAFMKKWIKEYGFSMELVLEACSRTMGAIHQPSFEYADTILSNWHKNQVNSLADVTALDAKHQKSKSKSPDGSNSAAVPATASNAVKKAAANNRFNNFKQRDYDFEELEKQLINNFD